MKAKQLAKEITKCIETQLTSELEVMLDALKYRVVYDFYSSIKYKLTHRYDMPWDSSGEVYSDPRNSAFLLEDYATVGDFLEEYTGNKTPSFMSGYGWFHHDFKDEYEKELDEEMLGKINDLIYSLDVSILITLLKEVPGYEDSDLHSLMAEDEHDDAMMDLIDHYEFEYIRYDYISCLLERLGNLSFKDVHGDLKEEVLCDIEEYEANLERERKLAEERYLEEKAQYEEFLPCFVTAYKTLVGNDLPSKVCMKSYNDFYSYLKALNVSKEEMYLLLKFKGSMFSKKVTCLFQTYK